MHIDRTERTYMIIAGALIAVFFGLVVVSSLAYGIQVPAPEARVDPQTVATPGNSPWGDPIDERVRELAPGQYEAFILAQTWVFLPNVIEVPVGSTVTFQVTSKDVQHGFNLSGTNINMMIIPGQVSKLTATFNEPGEYAFICNEYCGIGHQTMFGRLIVTDEG
ncbi:MAG: cytochrome c oxidase subunit II [Anaerolineae bacterium]|nr:cytochrome c oxidase subunit II [Anaerolineae bacterium]MCO5188374.1 cytochrome c oxidase subunit II [Anaerolineae bacterium]MCO5197243.1 cytochrome c oxidase subunit II [Anaerolineae bacterium]MCO5204819.1 cytochrome c oxidase subunit II [Anaerolineae bacterium]